MFKTKGIALFLAISLLIIVLPVFSEGGEKEVTVKSGDSLWSISQEYLKDSAKWRAIAKFNSLDNPDLITPGMKIKIPGDDYAAKESVSAVSTPISKSKGKSKSSSKKVLKKEEPPKIIIEEKIIEEPKLERDLSDFENEFNELLAKDSMIKNQREYFQIIKTLDDIKKEIALNNRGIAAELFEKVDFSSKEFSFTLCRSILTKALGPLVLFRSLNAEPSISYNESTEANAIAVIVTKERKETLFIFFIRYLAFITLTVRVDLISLLFCCIFPSSSRKRLFVPVFTTGVSRYLNLGPDGAIYEQ